MCSSLFLDALRAPWMGTEAGKWGHFLSGWSLQSGGWSLIFTFTVVGVMSSSPSRNFHTNFLLCFFFSSPGEKKKVCVVLFNLYKWLRR